MNWNEVVDGMELTGRQMRHRKLLCTDEMQKYAQSRLYRACQCPSCGSMEWHRVTDKFGTVLLEKGVPVRCKKCQRREHYKEKEARGIARVQQPAIKTVVPDLVACPLPLKGEVKKDQLLAILNEMSVVEFIRLVDQSVHAYLLTWPKAT